MAAHSSVIVGRVEASQQGLDARGVVLLVHSLPLLDRFSPLGATRTTSGQLKIANAARPPESDLGAKTKGAQLT